MMNFRKATASVLVLAATLCGSAVIAQPAQPMRVLSGYPPGGGGDIISRAIADALQSKLGGSVIVENKPGAGGALAAQTVKNAAPDGNTLLVASDNLFIAPHTMKQTGYDALADFVPVAAMAAFDTCLATNPTAAKANTLKEFLDLVRKDSKLGNIGVPAPGSLPQFYAFVIGKTAGVDLTPVAYRGAQPMMADMTTGVLNTAIGPCREMMEQHRSGKLKMLGTIQPLDWAKDVPTFESAGFNVGVASWIGVFVPAKTSEDRIATLERALRELSEQAAFQERLANVGFISKFQTSKALREIARETFTYWGAQIRASGFQPE